VANDDQPTVPDWLMERGQGSLDPQDSTDDDDERTREPLNGGPSGAGGSSGASRGGLGAFLSGRQRILLLAVLVLLILALIIGVISTVALSQQKQPITRKVGTGSIILSVKANGVLQSAVYNVDFTGQGIISEIDVKIGQQVQAGDILAKLDPQSLQDAVNQAQAQVDAAQTNLNNAQTNLSNVQAQTSAALTAAYDQEQSSIAACKGDSSCIQRAKDVYAAAQAAAATQNANAQSNVDYWQGQLNTAQASLQTAQNNLNNAVLYAPHGGIVSVINGSVGGHPGDAPAGRAVGVFIQIVDLTQLQVSAFVNEKYVGAIAAQNIVTFTVDTYGSRVFKGTVIGVNPVGVGSGGVVNYPVLISVDSQGFDANGIHLLPGMQCKVTIITQQRTNVLVVPVSAVRFAQQAAPQNGRGLLSRKDILAALTQAQQLELNLIASGVDLSQDHPTLTYLVGYQKGKYVAIPIVLGLSDGKNYEVLAGLSLGQTYVIGQTGGF